MTYPQFFDIEPVNQFSTRNATIRRPRVSAYSTSSLLQLWADQLPQEIACFSYDDQHKFLLDDSSLRYYYPPTLPADLNNGFQSFHQLSDSEDDHLDGLVNTIAAHEQGKAAKLEADIITWRGMMTKV